MYMHRVHPNRTHPPRFCLEKYLKSFFNNLNPRPVNSRIVRLRKTPWLKCPLNTPLVHWQLVLESWLVLQLGLPRPPQSGWCSCTLHSRLSALELPCRMQQRPLPRCRKYRCNACCRRCGASVTTSVSRTLCVAILVIVPSFPPHDL
jgi:hypothetical protein